MRITAISLVDPVGRPGLELNAITAGLNVVCGPAGSGKTDVAGLLAHVLFGKSGIGAAGPGEVIVVGSDRQLRLRRSRDANGATRLTVSALDGASVDPSAIRRLVGGLSPTVLAPLCAISFRETPDLGRLLSEVFARGYRFVDDGIATVSGRRMAELAARRDLLAEELETRIAGQRRLSNELESRRRELDGQLREEQHRVTGLEQRLRAIETSLAETDARLRYRRLELNLELRWQSTQPRDWESSTDEVDDQIARSRGILSELAQREATIRARLAQAQASPSDAHAALAHERVWLQVTRQLAADLAGEVARLARASASQQCICQDAHPRLRPIVETVDRQLNLLEGFVDEQQRSLAAAQLRAEVEHLTDCQTGLRRHLDHLLERRQEMVSGPSAGRRLSSRASVDRRDAPSGSQTTFSSADAEQLEARRVELEQERLRVVEQTRVHGRQLRDLRAQRDTVDRQRAALLSARSIEHVQRELASVQQKLEQAANTGGQADDVAIADDNPARASDFLAQLTDGSLVRLVLVERGRKACVVDRTGAMVAVEALSAGERDQVYLSLCLALLSAAGRRGIWLPLVLDEPFERLDARSAAALATVLDDFSRQGHQVLVLTGRKEATERLSSVGATVHDLVAMRLRPPAPLSTDANGTRPAAAKKRRTNRRNSKTRLKRQERSAPHAGDSADPDRSDAA